MIKIHLSKIFSLYKNLIFIIISFIFLLIVLLAYLNKEKDKESDMMNISLFIQSSEFQGLLSGKIHFEDKKVEKYKKSFKPKNKSTFEEIVSWSKNKMFSIEVDLYLILSSLFSINNDEFEIKEQQGGFIIFLKKPKISSLKINFDKTMIDFRKASILIQDKDREDFIIQEVFDQNYEKYKSELTDQHIEEAENKVRKILRRKLLDIIHMNSVIQIKFF